MQYLQTTKLVLASVVSMALVRIVDTEKLPAPIKAFAETFSTIKASTIQS